MEGRRTPLRKARKIDGMVTHRQRRAEREGRSDEAAESVMGRRFEVYDEETAPVLSYYDAHLISDVIAVGTPAEVLMQVLQAIVPVYRDHFGNPLG